MNSIYSILKKCFVPLLVLFSFTVNAQDAGMQFFHGTWAEVKAEAKKQNKPIFMDAYTTWCGPCKRMSAQVFTLPEVGEYYNSNFINYKLDMEKGEGPEIARQFKVSFYPTYLFFSPDGELIHRAGGFKGAQEFITDGKNALDPNSSLYGLINRFKGGDRDTAFIKSLLPRFNDFDAKMQKDVLNAYWKGHKLKELEQPYPWAVFKELESDIFSERFDYVLKNKAALEKIHGKTEVEATIINKAGPMYQQAVETKDEKLYKRVHGILMTSERPEIKKFAAYGELMFLASKGDWKTFTKQADVFMGSNTPSADELTQLAWVSYNNTDDAAILKKAEEWAKKAVDMKRGYATLDTYANVLYKNKKLQEAEATAQEAINFAYKENADPSATTQLLQKIRSEINK